MARLKGLLKIEGTLDNLTFYKTQDGHLVKTKSGVSGDRIANDPNFQRTRENGSEFGSSASAGKLLRNAVRNFAQSYYTDESSVSTCLWFKTNTLCPLP